VDRRHDERDDERVRVADPRLRRQRGRVGRDTRDADVQRERHRQEAVASSILGLDPVNPLGTVGAGTSASAQAWASTSMSPAAGDITIAVTSYFSSGGVTDGGTNTPSAGTSS
jgi:hypothetical protein